MPVSEKEVPQILCSEITDPFFSAGPFFHASSVFRQMDMLAAYVRELIENNETEKLAACFRAADNLLKNGCANVKTATGNVFMFTVGRIIDQSATVRNEVKALLTPALLAVYNTGLFARGN